MSWRGAFIAFGLCGCATTAQGPQVKAQHLEPEVVVRHRVERGQTLWRIARAYGLGVDELMRANRLGDPSELSAGEELLIPGATEVRAVGSTDAPEPVATGPRRERSKPPILAPIGRPGAPLSWPLRGVLYAGFGRKGSEAHDGIDLASPAGTPVRTAAPGTVLHAGDQKGYGLIVIIEHAGGLVTLYAHNRDLRVRTGQIVRAGQVIATVGDSGRTSGPHLHFEVRRDGVPIDPLEVLGPVPPPNARGDS